MDASRDLSRSFSLTNKKLTLISNHSNSGENFPSSSSFDITARIILIGDSGVGKSSIILRYIQDSFKEKSPCTAGVELSMKPIMIDGEEIKLQIWDTAGQEKYRTVTKSFYKQALGAVLVFDLTSKESFDGLEEWWKLLEENAPLDVSIIVVGNKADLIKERKVENIEINELMERKQLKYYETSAKSKKNIDNVFLELAKCIKKKKFDNIVEDKNIDERKSVRINSSWEAQSPVMRLKPSYKKENCC